jgi:hypothetical protein
MKSSIRTGLAAASLFMASGCADLSQAPEPQPTEAAADVVVVNPHEARIAEMYGELAEINSVLAGYEDDFTIIDDDRFKQIESELASRDLGFELDSLRLEMLSFDEHSDEAFLTTASSEALNILTTRVKARRVFLDSGSALRALDVVSQLNGDLSEIDAEELETIEASVFTLDRFARIRDSIDSGLLPTHEASAFYSISTLGIERENEGARLTYVDARLDKEFGADWLANNSSSLVDTWNCPPTVDCDEALYDARSLVVEAHGDVMDAYDKELDAYGVLMEAFEASQGQEGAASEAPVAPVVPDELTPLNVKEARAILVGQVVRSIFEGTGKYGLLKELQEPLEAGYAHNLYPDDWRQNKERLNNPLTFHYDVQAFMEATLGGDLLGMDIEGKTTIDMGEVLGVSKLVVETKQALQRALFSKRAIEMTNAYQSMIAEGGWKRYEDILGHHKVGDGIRADYDVSPGFYSANDENWHTQLIADDCGGDTSQWELHNEYETQVSDAEKAWVRWAFAAQNGERVAPEVAGAYLLQFQTQMGMEGDDIEAFAQSLKSSEALRDPKGNAGINKWLQTQVLDKVR